MNTIDVHAMELPTIGPKVIPLVLDFTTDTEIQLDFTDLIMKRQIDFVAGFFINNTGATNLTFVANGTNQIVNIAGGFQGYVPLLVADPASLVITADVAGEAIKIWFYNFPQFPFNVNGGGGGGAGNGEVDVIAVGGVSIGGQLPVALPDNVMNDFSLTLTGGADNLFPLDDFPWRQIILQNYTGQSTILINFAGGDPLTSAYELAAGEKLIIDGGINNQITVTGTLGDYLVCFAGY